MKYRYFSTSHPVSIGTFPDNGTVLGTVNFGARKKVSTIQSEAWGYIDYATPLTEKQISDYELEPESPEPKQLICSCLLEALKLTRGQGELKALDYDPEKELVTGTYKNGGKIEINVECDSGVSMIRDIMEEMR